MDRSIEEALALRLRKIAEQVKLWEQRDLDDEIASGARKWHRPLYWDDLENIAAMLEGQHREHRLYRKKAGKGRPGGLANVDRDLAIARLVADHQSRPNGSVGKGIEAAVAHFNVSEKAAEKAWLKMKLALEPGNEQIVPFFEKLALRGLAKVTRHKNLKK